MLDRTGGTLDFPNDPMLYNTQLQYCSVDYLFTVPDGRRPDVILYRAWFTHSDPDPEEEILVTCDPLNLGSNMGSLFGWTDTKLSRGVEA